MMVIAEYETKGEGEEKRGRERVRKTMKEERRAREQKGEEEEGKIISDTWWWM